MSDPRWAEAAHLLLEARRSHQTIDPLPNSCRPLSIDDGYAVQDALVALSGARVVGWKLGATTPYWQKRASLSDEPPKSTTYGMR